MESPKYPRTYHLPWSLGKSSDDKVMKDVSNLIGIDLVITEKMDGSNVCIERRDCFARTHSGSPNHPSFDAFKQLHASIKHKIPEGYQVFGEWCYALHSIPYTSLPGYFLMFGLRDTKTKSMTWASWEDVELWVEELQLPTVPVLKLASVESIEKLRILTESLAAQPSVCGGEREGLVVRAARGFYDGDFSKYVAKFVRKDHVASNDEHWKKGIIIKNIKI